MHTEQTGLIPGSPGWITLLSIARYVQGNPRDLLSLCVTCGGNFPRQSGTGRLLKCGQHLCALVVRSEPDRSFLYMANSYLPSRTRPECRFPFSTEKSGRRRSHDLKG